MKRVFTEPIETVTVAYEDTHARLASDNLLKIVSDHNDPRNYPSMTAPLQSVYGDPGVEISLNDGNRVRVYYMMKDQAFLVEEYKDSLEYTGTITDVKTDEFGGIW